MEIGKSRRNSRNSRNEIRYSLMVHTSRISQGKQTNLTSNNSTYTPERAASTDTLSAGPKKEHHQQKEQHQEPGCPQTSDIGLHEAERAQKLSGRCLTKKEEKILF